VPQPEGCLARIDTDAVEIELKFEFDVARAPPSTGSSPDTPNRLCFTEKMLWPSLPNLSGSLPVGILEGRSESSQAGSTRSTS